VQHQRGVSQKTPVHVEKQGLFIGLFLWAINLLAEQLFLLFIHINVP